MRGSRAVLLTSVCFLLASLVAACDKGVAPTTPSSTNAPATAGAVITGSLTGTSVSSISTQSTTAMTVFVVGTTITATIDSAGHFVLTGVPAGDVHLRFHGNNVDATATLTAVKSTDSITITVTITGSTAAIVSDNRDGNDQGNASGQASGTISGLTGAAPALTFVVNGTTVHTNANTRVRTGENDDNVSLADDNGGDDNGNGDEDGSLSLSILQNGLAVTVEGMKQPDGSILASEITIKTASARGSIAGFTGACPVLHFTVGSTTVVTTATTAFKDVSCSNLKNGTVVEVKGIAAGSVLTAISVEKDYDGPQV